MPKPVRVTVTAEGSRRLYNTRALKSGDMADLDYASVDPAIILGLVQTPTGWVPRYRALVRPTVEPQAQSVVQPRPRGRPRKAVAPKMEKPQTEEPSTEAVKADEHDKAEVESLTVPELREVAEEKGVELPSGYVPRKDLLKLLGESDEADEG